MTLAPEVQLRGGNEPSTQEEQLQSTAVTGEDAESVNVVVRLIRTQRIPREHGALLQVKVEGRYDRSKPILFQPNLVWMKDNRVVLEDTLINPDCDGHACLPVSNYQDVTLKLESGKVLGQVETCLLEERNTQLSDGQIYHIPEDKQRMETVTEEAITRRKEQLADLLDFSESPLPPSTVSKIQAWVLEHEDLFAITDTDMGKTHLVEHDIHTGDHLPIRQRPRREAFSLRPRIASMVEELLEKGLIQPSSSPWASPVVLVKMKS